MTMMDIRTANHFSMHFCFRAVFEIMGRPRKFFDELPPTVGLLQSLIFLGTTALFFCLAGLMNSRFHVDFIMGGIQFFNAVGMVFIMAALGYMVMILLIGPKVPFVRLFNIYALCSGVTLLVSWVPYLVGFIELWKWYLIGVGLVKGCGLKLKEALLIMIFSLAIWILFYGSLMPIITR